MSLSKKQRKFTFMVGRLIDYAYCNGIELTLGHAWRGSETQRRLVDAGLSKTMASKHCDRLAVDLNIFIGDVYMTDKEAYRPLGEHWESIGGRWGGRFGVDKKDYDIRVGWDAGHFEHE